MKKIFVFIAFFLSTVLPLNAQDDVRGELNEIENDRASRIESQLLLNVPEISDNPNHIITFQDPSGKGVFLEIDAQGFNQISSPYTLPSLGLGKHILTFKFTDNQDTEQIVEKTFTVIPRAPVINPPKISENQVTVTGTAIPSSKVNIFLSKDTFNKQVLTDVDEAGNWEYIFDEEIEQGTYTLVALTRRNGYASYFSEPIVFTVDNESFSGNIKDAPIGIAFSFKDIDFSNPSSILDIFKKNTDLIIVFASLFFFGLILGFVIIYFAGKVSQKKSKRVLQELLKQRVDVGISLKDRFEKSKEEPKKEEEEKKVEKKEKEKVEEKEEKKEEVEDEDDAVAITKEEFLKRFKDHDPDDDEGNEKKGKKNIKISLTSKD
jgi:hypothetical protein